MVLGSTEQSPYYYSILTNRFLRPHRLTYGSMKHAMVVQLLGGRLHSAPLEELERSGHGLERILGWSGSRERSSVLTFVRLGNWNGHMGNRDGRQASECSNIGNRS